MSAAAEHRFLAFKSVSGIAALLAVGFSAYCLATEEESEYLRTTMTIYQL
jgi:hypothetical protein